MDSGESMSDSFIVSDFLFVESRHCHNIRLTCNSNSVEGENNTSQMRRTSTDLRFVQPRHRAHKNTTRDVIIGR